MTARRRVAVLGTPLLLLGAWTPVSTAADDAPDPLAALEDDAAGALRVTRDEAGHVVAVDSVDGEAVVSTSARTPAAAAREVLAEHGEVVGLGSGGARVEQVLPAAAGATVVRAQQVVDGLPVLGGVVVTVLDAGRDLVSLSGATSRAGAAEDAVAAGEVGLPAAEATARRAVARAHGLAPADLVVESLGPWLYDPALLGVHDDTAVRPVWRLEVGSARAADQVAETVLVEREGGAVALRFGAAPRASATGTVVCDRERRASDTVEDCDAAPRTVDAPATGVADVDAAHEHLAETVATYADLGVDLGALLGGPATATVGWCPARGCRAEAFWDQRRAQAYFGPGMPLADDVVAHELTHGWVHATAGLFYFQQSGAVDESVADVLGEVVDHRHGDDDDSAWRLGEDAPGFTSRSLADPASDGRPDRMSSSRWVDEHALQGRDAGGVHANLGVGGRTAHLVSQGGTFNGRTVVGIDAGDPTLAKTATLWVQSVPLLTPGADYADLGRVLSETCVRLAAAGEAGFTPDDCTSVREAVAATELATPPTVGRQPVTVPIACAAGTTAVTVRRDDDEALVRGETPRAASFGLVDGSTASWTVRDEYAVSGRSSRVLSDRAPGTGAATVTSAPFQVPTNAGGSFVHFHHASAFQVAADGSPVTGGRLLVEQQSGSGWVRATGLPWRNGPTDRVAHLGEPVFGGDSRGWGASQVDLTSLRGEQVRLTWVVDAPPSAGPTGPGYGWWLDDVRLYTCATALTAAPTKPAAVVSGAGATLSWESPATQQGEVVGYRVTRSDSQAVLELPDDARRAVVAGLAGTADVDLRVAAVGVDGVAGPAATARVEATTASLAAPAAVKRRARFTVSARVVEKGTSRAVRGVVATLQRLPAGARSWATVARTTSNAKGALSWTVRQSSATAYRVVTTPVGRHQGTTSPARTVRLR